MNQKEIIEKLEARELEERLLKVNMCPKCGADLQTYIPLRASKSVRKCPVKKCGGHYKSYSKM